MTVTSEVQQTSAGGIVFKPTAQGFEVVLTARLNGRIWCLPKGIVEINETPEEAAVRETREETGLECVILDKLGDTHYKYYSRREETRISKTVHFYLMRCLGGNENDHDWEVDEVRWFPLNEALDKLEYEGEKNVMKKALELLTSKYRPSTNSSTS